jgi:hypothetical protein
MVYSLRTISSNHICSKAKTISAVKVKSGQAIKLNSRCYIRTMDHIIMADETEDIEVHSKLLDWTWTLGKLFQQPKNEIVTAAMEKLQTKIAGKFATDVLLHKLDTLMKEVTPEHWTFTSLGVMIAGTMIIFLIRLCQTEQVQAYPVPSAPLVPLVFNMTGDLICR